MASLLARHQTSCATYPGRESSFDKAPPANGCTCQPTYYTVMHLGKRGRVNVAKNRNAAKTALRKHANEADAGRSS